MVAVELHGNYIDAKPLQTRQAKDLTSAYQKIYQHWKATGVICPNWHILDKKAPEQFMQVIHENNCRVEFMPADIHRQNAAEKGIQTCKGHFISVLAGISDDFPIREWDELLPQTILTLNLMQQSNVVPNISAYAYHHGSFITIRCHYPQWAAQYSFTSIQTDAEHGVNFNGWLVLKNVFQALQVPHCVC